MPTDKIPQELLSELSKYTSGPWVNGPAYASFVGYPQRIDKLERAVIYAAERYEAVIARLREEKNYKLSDELRAITQDLRQHKLPNKN